MLSSQAPGEAMLPLCRKAPFLALVTYTLGEEQSSGRSQLDFLCLAPACVILLYIVKTVICGSLIIDVAKIFV